MSEEEARTGVKPRQNVVNVNTLGTEDKKVEEAKEEQDYEDDYSYQPSLVVGSAHTVEAAKNALKNSFKTLIQVSGIYLYFISHIDVQMLGAALAGFESLKLTCLCAVCGLPFDGILTLLDSKNK